jgi:SAM-dependent methyltransferase
VYSDADTAALYELLNPWGRSDSYYLTGVLAAASALDVGCGNGTLLHRARTGGHTGRLCGVDPDPDALDLARRHADIEWVAGTAAAMTFAGEFAHAVMAGNAFQCLIGDDEVSASLAAVRAALVPGGTFAFDTRNPLVRAWESWTPESTRCDVVDRHGTALRVHNDVEAVAGDVVTVTETVSTVDGVPLRTDRAPLRFLPVEALDAVLDAAEFVVAQRFGDFTGGPFTPTSESIVTVARRA